MLIGIVGKKQTGKDEIAKVLCEEYGFTRLGFADALKEDVKRLFKRTLIAIGRLHGCETPDNPSGADWEQWFLDELLRVKPAGVRELLQEYATEVRRGDDNMYWVDAWRETYVAKYERDRIPIVVPDVRFTNEADEIIDWGGVIWSVDRPGAEDDPHESEQLVPYLLASEAIDNSGSLTDLKERVRRLYERTPKS